MSSTIEESSAMKTYTFDIKVALIGYVSVGKSTVLNALLGDQFSEVALKRTTAGVNFFRIQQPAAEKTESNDVEASSSGEEGWSTIGDDDRKVQAADVVHEEISKDNQDLRSSWLVEEKTFDISIRHSICKMRKDTQLVLIDIPGINEAESSKKYKDYVESNWKTFDCVVVVMDAVQGVNTQEQVDLLEFVHRNNQEVKDVPTIVLGNKMDDLDDKDTIHQIEETRAKTVEIFGNIDYRSISREGEETETEECKLEDTKTSETEKVEAETAKPKSTDGKASQTAFIPLSAKNAFMYMKAGSIDRDQMDKYQDIVNKIGIDEYGRKFSKMKPEDKIEAFLKILEDPSELQERLADTNFNSFLSALSDFIGGETKQKEILARKVSVALKSISIESIGERSVSEFILEAFNKSKLIGLTDFDWIKETFWQVYLDRENKIFEDKSPVYNGPKAMGRSFTELKKYHALTLVLGWEDESLRAMDAMKKLLRRQFLFLLEKLDGWSFEAFCRSAGGKEVPFFGCSDKDKGNIVKSLGRTYPAYTFFDGESTVALGWENGWKTWRAPEDFQWQSLSPQDWIVILESLSLVWNHTYFVKNFGSEKVKLSRTLAKLYNLFLTVGGMYAGSKRKRSATHIICMYAYKDEIERRGGGVDYTMAQIVMPLCLDDPHHWGYLAWKYIDFCNDQQTEEMWRERNFLSQA